ncbi:unnamed protein product [Hermetia illucens]|uniref:Uncharacterized protein n=1 Tax=Hermetia illucens TaxID=343691 RepID=A0A7R8UCZ0_HERIL|nr:unnamed protein product [Hermetia illucens]
MSVGNMSPMQNHTCWLHPSPPSHVAGRRLQLWETNRTSSSRKAKVKELPSASHARVQVQARPNPAGDKQARSSVFRSISCFSKMCRLLS